MPTAALAPEQGLLPDPRRRAALRTRATSIVSTDEGRRLHPPLRRGRLRHRRRADRRRSPTTAEKKDDATRRRRTAEKKPEGDPGEPLPDGDRRLRPDARSPSRPGREALEPSPATPTTSPTTPSPRTPTIPSTSPSRRPPRRRPKRDKADYEKKIADGKKQVKELTDRFAALVLRHARRELPLDQPGSGRRSSSPRAARAPPRPAVRSPAGSRRCRRFPGGFPAAACRRAIPDLDATNRYDGSDV